MKKFQAIEYIFSITVQPTGAKIQRGLFERKLSLPDSSLFFIWWILVIFDWFSFRLAGIFDWFFIGWPDDLKLIGAAINGFFPQGQAAAI